MVPSSSTSRKAKRKTERAEKKQLKHKRQRNGSAAVALESVAKATKAAPRGDKKSFSKQPKRQPSAVPNKFFELIGENGTQGTEQQQVDPLDALEPHASVCVSSEKR